jgi:hypothetical protein
MYFVARQSRAPLHNAHAFHLHLPITLPHPHAAHWVRDPSTHLRCPSPSRAAHGGSTWPDVKRSRVLRKM